MTKQKIKYHLSITILSLFLSLHVNAQVYPVQINTQLIPPYSLSLSDYVSSGTSRVGLNMLLTDINEPEYYVRLELFIEGDGITIKTNPAYNPGPIILTGGVPEYFTSSDLEGYFDPRNLDFSGYSKSDYLSTGRLPEGVYRFYFRAYDYNKGVRVSNGAPVTAWLLLNDPPIINLPFPDHKVEHIDPQNIVFQWMPRHTGSPNSAFTTEYEFTLVEIWPEGRDPNNAMQTSIPIFQETTTSTSLVYGLSEPFLEPGRQYAYRIRAYDIEERDMFKNNGCSEVRMFTFGDECKPVNNVEAISERYDKAEISWQPAFNQTAFNVRYRKANDPDAEWFEEDTYMDYVRLSDLQELTEYEYQVMGYCGTYESDYSDLKTFTTPAPEVSSFECGGSDDGSSISNHDPLPALYVGNYIWSGNFMFKIKEATGSNGTFSGTAYAMVPYLSFVKLAAEFKNIKVNTDNQVYEGEITSVYNPDSPFIIGIGGGDDDDGSGDGSGGGSTDDTEISDSTFTTDIDSVYIDGDDIIIITEDGTDTIHTTEDIIITDEDGDTWVVEDGVVVTGGGGTGPGGGGSGDGGDIDEIEETEEQEKKVNIVMFKKYLGQNNGFDPYDEKIKAAYSPPFEFGGEEYYASWKAIKEGGFDHVTAAFELEDTAYNPDDVKFKMATGTSLSAESIPGSENKSVYLFGQVDETEDEIIAYVTETDTAENELDREIGKLRVVSYREEAYEMKLVPVNMDMNEVNLSGLAQKINDIYSQSVVKWNITLDTKFSINTEDWDKDENGVVDDSESGLFSNYTKEMNRIIGAYKDERDADKNTYYVFLLGDLKPQSGNLAGYMPFKQQFGLIFIPVTGKDETQLARIVSHEIGHGAFRLYHTFSSEGKYIRSQATTNNLMDYNNGTHLNKYQWDFIHDPESMIAWMQDDEESALISNEVVKGYWKKVDPPQLYEARNALKYHKIFIPNDDYIRNTHTLIELVDGSMFLVSPMETGEDGYLYKLKLPNDNTWNQVFLSSFEYNCLSCELNYIGSEIAKLTGTTIGRYILPIEDGYILITGEDFDGNESSRIAAGGFIILEVVQAGKVFKLIKGAKIITKSGRAANTSIRVIKHFASDVTKDAIADMSIQFFINFIYESIENQDADAFDIAAKAFTDIDLKNAIISGMINYASFDNSTKSYFDCAQNMFNSLEKGRESIAVDLSKGTIDCFIDFIVGYAFKNLRNSPQIKNLAEVISDTKNYDIILDKLSKILSEDALYRYTQELTANGIKRGGEILW